MDDKVMYENLIENVKENIINWYPFEEDSKILEIANKEDFLEIDAISKENITSVKTIEAIEKIQEQFNYILIISKLNELEDKLSIVIEKLKSNGKILLIENNVLSIKNICELNQKEGIYNLKQIEEILKKYDINNKKIYYVLHDYKKANVIFTDKHLPDKETIQRNITFYNEEIITGNNENDLYKEILNQDANLFKFFANSFFIECAQTAFEENEIEFVSYSNIRKEKYRIKTIISRDKVYKTYANKNAKEHIEQVKKNIDIMNQNNIKTLDSYDKEKIISKYQQEKETLEEFLINKIESHDVEIAKEIIIKFYEELKEKLVKVEKKENVFEKYGLEYEKENIDNLNFVKYGLWDLIFQNTFYIDEEFVFYDQEWIEENIPVEYIMYRTIKYSMALQNLLTKETLYDIIGINKKNIELFDKLDEVLQQKIRCEEYWQIHAIPNNSIQIIDTLKKEKETMYQESLKLLNEKDARIKFLEDNMEETCNILHRKEDFINQMQNSISWKITRPLRIKNKLKKGEENENKR